jgi:hypothetical protein
MKKSIFKLAFFVAILSVSCEKIKEATQIDIKTNLEIEVPVATITKSGLITKSADVEITAFVFGGNGTFSMTNNDDISDYINNIDDIMVNGVSKVQIINVPAGGSISACKLMYGINPDTGTTGFNVLGELTATNGIIEITDVAWINQLITLIKQNKQATFKFVVSGNASYDIQSSVKIKIPVIIVANPL